MDKRMSDAEIDECGGLMRANITDTCDSRACADRCLAECDEMERKVRAMRDYLDQCVTRVAELEKLLEESR